MLDGYIKVKMEATMEVTTESLSSPTVVAEGLEGGSDDSVQKDNCSQSPTVSVPAANLSKKQLRKLDRIRQWQETKQLRKEKRRQKKQEFKEKKRQRIELIKSEAAEKGEDPTAALEFNSRKSLKSNSMQKSLCKVGVCIDMNFNHLMVEKDLNKCVKQIHRCYGINRRLENPVQYHVTSFTGKAVEIMNKNDGWKNWDVYFHEKSYLELDYPKDKIVYLTADSENVLNELDDSKLYVIGGLVDHNSKKGLCHKLALENGVGHARLPLNEFVDMKVRKVLNIVHVFEILGNVAQKRQWHEAIMDTLPRRSNAKLKRNGTEDDQTSEDDDED